jgi:hypothetical protein
MGSPEYIMSFSVKVGFLELGERKFGTSSAILVRKLTKP